MVDNAMTQANGTSSDPESTRRYGNNGVDRVCLGELRYLAELLTCINRQGVDDRHLRAYENIRIAVETARHIMHAPSHAHHTTGGGSTTMEVWSALVIEATALSSHTFAADADRWTILNAMPAPLTRGEIAMYDAELREALLGICRIGRVLRTQTPHARSPACYAICDIDNIIGRVQHDVTAANDWYELVSPMYRSDRSEPCTQQHASSPSPIASPSPSLINLAMPSPVFAAHTASTSSDERSQMRLTASYNTAHPTAHPRVMFREPRPYVAPQQLPASTPPLTQPDRSVSPSPSPRRPAPAKKL